MKQIEGWVEEGKYHNCDTIYIRYSKSIQGGKCAVAVQTTAR